MKKLRQKINDFTINSPSTFYLHSLRKRIFDVVITFLMLPFVFVIILIAGIIIFLFEGRPILFIHYRSGKNGNLFLLPKLRTMRTNANPYQSSIKSDHKKLVTKTGKILRKYKIDELPQLFSVLKGNMSLVGPRPDIPNNTIIYNSIQKRRLHAKPGITGLWQIMGDHSRQMHQNIKYDLYYLRKANLWLDIKILFRTFFFLLKQT